MIDLKSVTCEVGSGAVPDVVVDFIAEELNRATEQYESVDAEPAVDVVERCEAFFFRAIDTYG